MNEYFLKNPASELDYTFDWGSQILTGGEQITSDLGWTVTPDEAAAGGLVVVSTSNTSTTTTAVLGGGKPGEAYLVASHIQTTNGRKARRSLTIRIGNS
ncbi:MAG: phage fiber-tail adaptor protein [Alphaproteobacteria bacterium]